MKVLVVDDDQNLSEVVALQLRELGHEAVLSGSAEEALSRMDEEPDCGLVLTDVRMPGRSGIDFLHDLQSRPFAPPVAIMSGRADLSMAIQAMRLRAIDFLIKPFGQAAIRDLLNRAVAMTESEEVPIEKALPILKDDYRVVLPTSRDWIAGACRHLLRILEGRLSKQDLGNMRLAMHEALFNAVIHGNLGVDSGLKEKDEWLAYEDLVNQRSRNEELASKTVTIEMSVSDREVRLSIEDEGDGFDPYALPGTDDPEAMLMSSGRGLMLIRYAMDAVSWNEKANRIELVKRLNRG